LLGRLIPLISPSSEILEDRLHQIKEEKEELSLEEEQQEAGV
jgi:hypothetical protein